MITPPAIGSPETYRDRLGDADFWRPWAAAALRQSGLPVEPMDCGFAGTYPTLVGDSLVVKLFGYFGDWRRSAAAETAANDAVAAAGLALAPRLAAAGTLFPGRADEWPYLITERLAGVAWRDAALPAAQRCAVAEELGRQLRRVHAIPAPGDVRDDWLARHGAQAAERHRRWGSLPARLIDQIPGFLADFQPAPPVLTHGDVTEDHIFVAGGRLAGVIDWGDAMISDPLYDFGPLHLGAFGADGRLLRAFAGGYGLAVDAQFAVRATQVALMHEFDLFAGLGDAARNASSLTSLADVVWGLDRR